MGLTAIQAHEEDFMIRSWTHHVSRLQLEQRCEDERQVINYRRHLMKGFAPTQGEFMTVATQTAPGSEVERTRTLIDARREERAIELPESMWQRIAAKAYALYEKRGCRDGYAVQDWLDAEYIVNDEIYETH